VAEVHVACAIEHAVFGVVRKTTVQLLTQPTTMATTKRKDDMVPLLVAPSVGAYGVTRRDHQLAKDNIAFDETVFQADSPHSGILTSILSAIDPVMGIFGANTGLGGMAANLSRKVGQVTGLTGIFDQPAISVECENANAVVDRPQLVRSLKLHEGDWVNPVDDIISSGHDEMDLLARLRIPARIVATPWTGTKASGEVLYEFQVHPGNCVYYEATMAQNFNSTPLAFFSTFFEYYRGSIEVTVEVVSTKLHQGQLFLTFDPLARHSNVPHKTRDQLRTCPFAIIDISHTKRYTERIPYLSPFDYNRSNLPMTVIGQTPYDSLGRFSIMVQNPLVAPTTVGASVDVNIYINAGPDFEFMMPKAEPSLFYYENGSFQGDEGQFVNTVPVEASKVIPVRSALQQVTHVANVASADTENILGRDYMVASGVEWSTSQATGTELANFQFPSVFWQEDLATHGLANYHAYQRMDFEFTIKVNPSAFHAGMLLVNWFPRYKEDTTGLSYGSVYNSRTQFPHAFIDLSAETECKLRVPYSYYSRVMPMSGFPVMGFLNISVWNQLTVGTGQPTKLYVTVFAKALAPYVGVKCPRGALAATFQGDAPSDASENTSITNCMYPEPLGKENGGYVRTAHTSVKDLLRRPDWVGNVSLTLTTTPGYTWTRIARVPAFGGKYHRALIRQFTYWTGSNKLWFVSNLSANSAVSLAFVLNCTPYALRDIDKAIIPIVRPVPMRGVVLPRTIDRNTMVVDVPMYKATPLVSTDPVNYSGIYGTDFACAMPVVDVYVIGSTTTTITMDVLHAVGDDFQAMLWRAPMAVQELGTATDGLIPQALGTVTGPWTFSGTSIAATSQPWYAFSQNNDLATYFSSQIGRTIKAACANSLTDCKFAVMFTTPVSSDMGGQLSFKALNTVVFNFDFTIVAGKTLSILAFDGPAAPWDNVTWSFITDVTGGIVIRALQLFENPPTPFQLEQLMKRDFSNENVGGRGSTQGGSFANRCELECELPESDVVDGTDFVFVEMQAQETDLIEAEYQGVMDTMNQYCNTFREAIANLDNLNSICNKLRSVDVLGICNWFREIVSLVFSFIRGMLLTFVCQDRLAKTLGLVELTQFTASVVVAQHPKPPTTGAIFQGAEGERSFASYFKFFLAKVKQWCSTQSGYSMEHMTKYVSVRTAKLKADVFSIDYMFAYVEAIVTYILEGDKVIFDYIVTKQAEFVELVIDGVTLENREKISELRSGIDVLASRLPRFKLPDSYRTYCIKFDKRLLELETKECAVNAIPEPIGVYICAAPGTGKSTVLCQVLPALLRARVGWDGTADEFSVNTSMDTQGRIDKYDGQPVAIFDEFGSNCDANEAATVIKMVSQFAENVQSAFLDKKGKSFRSRVLMLLSNLDNVQMMTGNVRNIDAMARRFSKFSYTMELRTPSGCSSKPVFKFDKFRQQLDACTTHDSVIKLMDETFVFYPLDIMTGISQFGNPRVFGQVFEELVTEWFAKLKHFQCMEALVERIAQMPVVSEKATFQGRGFDPAEGTDDSPYYSSSEDSPVRENMKYVHTLRNMERSSDGEYLFCLGVSSDISLCQVKGFSDADIRNMRELLNELKDRGIDSKDGVSDGVVTDYASLMGKMEKILNVKPFPGLLELVKSCITLKSAGITVAVVSLISTVAWSWRSLRSVVDLQHGYDTNRWTIVPKRGQVPASKVIQEVHNQGLNERHEKIRRNMRRVCIGETGYQMCCVCLDNQTLLLNRHFVDRLQANQMYISVHDYTGVEVSLQPLSFSPKDIRPVGVNTDLVVLTLRGATISGARNIRSFIPAKSPGKSQATLLALNGDHDMEGEVNAAQWTSLKDSKTGIFYSACPAFQFQTQRGDCGRPYVTDGHEPLLGIHCALSDKAVAYFIPLCASDLPVDDSVDSVEMQISNVGPPAPGIECPGVVGKVLWNGLPLKSNSSPQSQLVPLRRSNMRFAHPDWECDMQPANLRNSGPNSMLVKNSTKYAVKPLFAIPISFLDKIVHYWKKHIPQGIGCVYSMEVAVNGCDGFNSLQWNTSIGWLREAYSESGKKALFENAPGVEDWKVFTEAAKTKVIPRLGVTFVGLLEQQDASLRQGKVPFSPWLATLKDELRPVTKVREGKTRIFEIPGIDVTLHIRKYFGDFTTWYKNHFGFRLCHGIGANKESEWKAYMTEFMSLVDSDPQVFVDLDYSNYDGSVNQTAFAFFREITDWFYEDDVECRRARHALLQLLCNACIVLGEDVLFTSQGNKSGNPLTDLFNSITNVFILQVCFMLNQSKAGVAVDPSVVHRGMRLLTYGDDVIFGVTAETKSWMDLGFIQDSMSCFGYTVTDGAKKAEIEWKVFSEVQFLKSKFVPYKNVVLAPMEKKSIYKELFWEKRGQEKDKTIFEQKLDITQQFMAHHGEVEYNLFQRQLRERGVGKIYLLRDWQERIDDIERWQCESRCEVF